MMKAGEPGVKLPVSPGPKSAGPPVQPRVQLSQRDARGDEIILQSRQGFEPKSKVPHELHSAYLDPGPWARLHCSFQHEVGPSRAPGWPRVALKARDG